MAGNYVFLWPGIMALLARYDDNLHMSNPVRFFRRLQAGGMSRWNAARKHAVLRPFAWIYQIGYINKRLIKNGISPGKVAEQHTQGVKQRELIRALGLDIDNRIDVRRDEPHSTE